MNNANNLFNESWKPIVENLAKPTEYLLMDGGDLRLNIDEINLLNKYDESIGNNYLLGKYMQKYKVPKNSILQLKLSLLNECMIHL